MNDRDRDLIVDLLEGRLSQAETAAAMSRVADDPALAAAYHQQMAVRDTLTGQHEPVLSDAERSNLRADLVEQLHLQHQPVRSGVRRSRRRWWQPVLGLTTVAAAVVAIALLPGTFGSSSDDAGTAEVRFTATDGAESLPPAAGMEQGAEDDTADMFAPGEPVEVVDLPDAKVDELLEATAGNTTPAEVERNMSALGYSKSLFIDGSVIEDCVNAVRSSLPAGTTSVLVLGADSTGESTIVHLGLTMDDGIEAVVTIDLKDCSILPHDS